jgi:hypothetical protein
MNNISILFICKVPISRHDLESLILNNNINYLMHFSCRLTDPKFNGKQLNHAWSKMLAKVLKIDVTKCVHCEDKLRAVATT